MRDSHQAVESQEAEARRGGLEGLLRGYRFSVCRSEEEVGRALTVRRRVYIDELGKSFSIPDQYDHRSWLLFAEDAASGEMIGTIRLTPRAAGPLEVERYFPLSEAYRANDTVEITRFTILREYRGTQVMAGLLKLAVRCLQQMKARWLVAGATQDRIGTYAWLDMTSTGLTAHHDCGSEVTLMACDFPEASRMMATTHPLREFLLEVESPEIRIDCDIDPSSMLPLVRETDGAAATPRPIRLEARRSRRRVLPKRLPLRTDEASGLALRAQA